MDSKFLYYYLHQVLYYFIFYNHFVNKHMQLYAHGRQAAGGRAGWRLGRQAGIVGAWVWTGRPAGRF